MLRFSSLGGPARLATLSLLLFVGSAVSAQAASVYGTSAEGELIGTRSVGGGGLIGYDDWATDFTVDWEIVQNGNLWHYEYTFTGLDGSGQEKEISHSVFDLSDDCTGSDCVFDVSPMPMDGEIEFGDKDGIVGAVKLDWGGGEGLVYGFDSNRAPVYGHLAIKGGGGPDTCSSTNPGNNVVCNLGLSDSESMDIADFIARPNGVVPEPSAGLLLAGSLLGAAVFARRS